MEKPTPILSDKNQFPTEEIIYTHLGAALPMWQELFDYIHTNHPDLSEEWRYYNDGKSWLFKITRKAKTVCWVSVYKGTFRMTFYFSDKAEAAIQTCAISEALKEQFRAGKRYNRIRGLSITFKTPDDDAQVLIPLKLSIK
jgi:hypothetical protein